MSDPAPPCFLSHFSALKDPRQAAKVLYPLDENLLLCSAPRSPGRTISSRSACGARSIRILSAVSGPVSGPSRAVQGLSPGQDGLREDITEVIAIDGKAWRRSHNRRKGRLPLHTVCARAGWAASGSRTGGRGGKIQ